MKPIEDQVCDVMADYRYRRLKYKVDNPDSILTDNVPDSLTRHAEAHAIAMLFPRAERMTQPLPQTSCDVCNAQNVEVSQSNAYGIETFACDKCRGLKNEDLI